MAGYDPKQRRAHRPVADDEPAAVDGLLGPALGDTGADAAPPASAPLAPPSAKATKVVAPDLVSATDESAAVADAAPTSDAASGEDESATSPADPGTNADPGTSADAVGTRDRAGTGTARREPPAPAGAPGRRAALPLVAALVGALLLVLFVWLRRRSRR